MIFSIHLVDILCSVIKCDENNVKWLKLWFYMCVIENTMKTVCTHFMAHNDQSKYK